MIVLSDLQFLTYCKHFLLKHDTDVHFDQIWTNESQFLLYRQSHFKTISPDGRVTIRRHPDTSKCIGMDLVLQKLPSAVLVHVDASRLAMVDLAVHYCWVGPSLHLKPCYAIMMNVASIKVALLADGQMETWMKTNGYNDMTTGWYPSIQKCMYNHSFNQSALGAQRLSWFSIKYTGGVFKHHNPPLG